MTTATTTAPSSSASGSTANLSTAISKGVESLRGQDGQPGATSSAAPAVAAAVVAGVYNAMLANPALASKAVSKDFGTPVPVTADDLRQESFWNNIGIIASSMIPVAVNSVSKDYKAPTTAISKDLTQDPEFWKFLNGAMQTLVPQVIGAITGKDYQPAPPPEIPAKDKDWFSDAMGVVGQALPVVLPIVLAAL